MYIAREIESKIKENLFKGKIIVIYGPRRVGKTTLVKNISLNMPTVSSIYLNCDEPDIRDAFTNKTSHQMKGYVGDNKLVILDEAQRIENIGLSLKLLIDTFPDIQIIATGSSSFELSNKINEPLTGRKFVYILHPISWNELKTYQGYISNQRSIEDFLRFGMYPNILLNDKKASPKALDEITTSYLFKDILNFQDIRNSEMLSKLLSALALQIGGEVSYGELSNLLRIDIQTVMRYIDILEKMFIVFRLPPFSRNLRKEISKSRKIYFQDLGIRNSLIRNFNPLDLRLDVGALWENFCVTERKKFLDNRSINLNSYFWRNYNQREVDLVEEYNGNLSIFEFKWRERKLNKKFPKDFIKTYPVKNRTFISKENIEDLFILN